MQITAIKQTRSSNSVILVFKNGSILPFSPDDVVAMGIKKYEELSSDFLREIYQKSINHQLWEYSLRQLLIISRPEKIITQKLKKYSQKIIHLANIQDNLVDVSPIIDKIIFRLKNMGILNNSVYAAGFVRKSHNKSKRQIIMELNRKGVGQSDQLLAVSELNDQDKIKKFFEKKKYTVKNFSDWKEKNKIIASLYRRGFALSDIKSVIDDLLINR